MYDRKTWFIVTACSVLLALNLYFKPRPKIEPVATPPAPTLASGEKPADTTASAPEGTVKESLRTIETGKVIFTFTNLGGGIRYADFKDQFDVGSKDRMVRINGHMLSHFPIGAVVGLNDEADTAVYGYDEAESVPGKKIVLVGTNPSGLKIRKAFSVIEDGKWWSPFMLDFNLQVENTGQQSVKLAEHGLFLGEAVPLHEKEAFPASFFWHGNGSIEFKDTNSFNGGMTGAYKLSVSNSVNTLKYAGVANQYFSTVIRPKVEQAATIVAHPAKLRLPDSTKELTSVRATLSLPTATLDAQQKQSYDYTVFIGPRHNAMLRQMGNDWSDIMPYGYFWWVANPLNRLLNWIHDLIDPKADGTKPWSWGLTIIVMTILVRTSIWPLYAKSTRSMKRMSKLQPEMAKLKEKYADDPTRMNQEMMKLYRTYGVNPIGGCLPMLIQLPIFYGFFRVLQYAVELRGHGFLWVHDLSQPDTQWVLGGVPINPLPIVMAITSFIQMAMTPKTGDKTQQRMMMFMPFMFVFFCYSFASALALYWTTTNIFSIVQTWITNKLPEPELKVRKVAAKTGKKSFMERMVEKQQEMERLQKLKQQGIDPGNSDDSKKKRPPRTGG